MRTRFLWYLLFSLGVATTAAGADIFEASRTGDLKQVTALLAATPALANAREEPNGFTPLMYAAYAGKHEVGELLIAHKADLGATSKDGLTALHMAAWGGSPESVKLLLKAGANVNGTNAILAITPLHLALLSEHRQVAALLVAAGADVNARDEKGMTALHTAAFVGDKEMAELLLTNRAEVDTQVGISEGGTPLHLAAGFGYEGVVRVLLGHNASVRRKNAGRTPLFAAAGGRGWLGMKEQVAARGLGPTELAEAEALFATRGGGRYAAVVRLLLEHKADVNDKDNGGWSVLQYAAQAGNREVAEILLAHGADINWRDREGYTALHTAAENGHADVVELLLSKGADVNSRTGTTANLVGGATPLHSGIRHEGVIRVLLAHRADVNAQNRNGLAPICYAANDGKPGSAKLLLEAKADLNVKCQPVAATPLHTAATGRKEWAARKERSNKGTGREIGTDQDFLALVELFLSRGVPIDAVNGKGHTPFIIAVIYGERAIAELLLSRGAAINARGRPWTAIGSAANDGDRETVEFLLARGADVNLRDASFRATPLHWAAGKGDLAMIQLLLRHRADINVKDAFGSTPWMQAASQGHQAVAEFLQANGATPDAKAFAMPGAKNARDGPIAKSTFSWCRQAAEKGSTEAMFCLAVLYGRGIAVKEDDDEAFRWLRKAAEAGNPEAQTHLGESYQAGNNVKQDLGEAVKWYRKAADQGYGEAQSSLGYMYQHGMGVPQDYPLALKWLRKSAEQENSTGQNNLGYMYQYGLGVSQDYAEAARWYRRAADHPVPDPNAPLSLGRLYENGWGVQRDLVQAFVFYSRAKELGNKDARSWLDGLVPKMTTAQLAEARLQFESWKGDQPAR